MSGRLLTLEIATPDGVVLREAEVERIVVHRRERAFDIGSEIAILPQHGPMLVRLPVAPARYRRDSATVHLALAGGFAQVRENRVLIVTARCEVAGSRPDAAAAARTLIARWTADQAGHLEALVGYT